MRGPAASKCARAAAHRVRTELPGELAKGVVKVDALDGVGHRHAVKVEDGADLLERQRLDRAAARGNRAKRHLERRGQGRGAGVRVTGRGIACNAVAWHGIRWAALRAEGASASPLLLAAALMAAAWAGQRPRRCAPRRPSEPGARAEPTPTPRPTTLPDGPRPWLRPGGAARACAGTPCSDYCGRSKTGCALRPTTGRQPNKRRPACPHGCAVTVRTSFRKYDSLSSSLVL